MTMALEKPKAPKQQPPPTRELRKREAKHAKKMT
jgi:hypothetical protein